MRDVDSSSLPQRRIAGRKRSTVDESTSFSTSETSAQSSRRLHDRSVIFQTRLNYALVIIGLQTGVTQLMFIFIQSEKYGSVITFVSTFLTTFFITLPLMVHQMFYGSYTRFGYIKFWNIAPVAFGIGISMAMYSFYECIVWAGIAGLLILHVCHVPFRSISQWTNCQNIQISEETNCYDIWSNLPQKSCQLTTYPGLEFYKEISYKSQTPGYSGINGTWFVCCLFVWLIVFLMVSQGFRRLKDILIRIQLFSLISIILLAIFLFGSQQKINNKHNVKIFQNNDTPTRYDMVWLVWYSIRLVQIPLGTLSQLASYSPSKAPLLADSVMILLFGYFANFIFTYFGHCCHNWIENNFQTIHRDCIATDEMTALFASIPTAISFLAMGNLWLFIFYTAFALKTIVQIVITLTATMNAMSEMFHLHRHRQQIVAVFCTIALLFNLPFTMLNSEIFFNKIYRLIELLVDLTIVSCGAIAVVCLYTFSRVFDDLYFVYNVEPTIFQKFISYLSSILMVFITITGYTSVVSKWPVDPISAANSWASPFIAFMVFLLLVPIPACAFYMYVVHLMKHNISAMLQPTAIWGPPEADVKLARLNFNPRCELKHKSKKPCSHNCLLNDIRIKIEVEKRDSQRKDFFLNIIRSPSYAEWGDDEDWHYDIIGRARTINGLGDFRQGLTPATIKTTDEEHGENKSHVNSNDEAVVENIDSAEDNVSFENHTTEDFKVESKIGTENVIVEEPFTLERDSDMKTEMKFESHIIFPDSDLNKLLPRIRHMDTDDIGNRMLSSPRYTSDYPTSYPRAKRREQKKQTKPLNEPEKRPQSRKTYLKINEKSKKQSRSKSSQTDKGLKRLHNFIRGLLPWKKQNKKQHRCVGTNPNYCLSPGCKKRRNLNDSSEEFETLNEMHEWP